MDNAYKVIEVIGTSEKSWEEAAQSAVNAASKSLKNLRIAEVQEMDLKIDDGKIIQYRTKLRLSFKLDLD